MIIMNAGLGGTPASGVSISPVFSDDKVSEDLQNAGYDQFSK